MRMRCLVLLLSLLWSAAAAPGAAAEPLKLGAGEAGGVYAALAAALAEMTAGKDGAVLAPQASAGSVENINAVADGRRALGLAQSDKLAQAAEGRAEWNRNPVASLRVLLALHEETVTLIAAEESGIRSVRDLRGKRVNLGAPGSGQHYNALQVLQAAGIRPEQDLNAAELSVADAAAALGQGKLDALFFTAGHPNELVRKLSEGTHKIRIVPLSCPGLALLPEANPALAITTLAAGQLYPALGQTEPVEAIGVRATLFCAAALPQEQAYQLVRAAVAGAAKLAGAHPALAGVTAQSMALDPGAGARHPGAERALREAGLLKE